MTDVKRMTVEEWEADGVKRFGPDKMKWRFVCPRCGHVAVAADWIEAGATEGAIAFSCVGRWKNGKVRHAFGGKGPGPCNYAGGGLFALNPVRVTYGDQEAQLFDFAEAA